MNLSSKGICLYAHPYARFNIGKSWREREEPLAGRRKKRRIERGGRVGDKKARRGREARRKSEGSPGARTERGSRKRGRSTVCLGVARGITERIVSLDVLGAI